jgi:peptidoglycan/LPS O-acetylase OafA/YrhL
MSQLDKGTSWYLDLIRGLAAIGVVISHAGHTFFSCGLSWTPSVGHQMVVLFFVLSGFVMSHAVSKVGNDWRAYVAARFSRISSVAYPALVLTVICDCFGRMADPELYALVARSDHYGWRIVLNAFFIGQSGPFSANPGSNTPFWSLAYEVWYYVLLGVWTFVTPFKRRVVWLLFAALIAGPKILLLLPVWLAGVFAHRCSGLFRLPMSLACPGYCISLLLLIGLSFGNLKPWGDLGDWVSNDPWFFSTGYLGDYQLGGVAALHFVAADQLFTRIGDQWIVHPARVCVRYVADRSFSLYAYHMPLLYLASVCIPYRKDVSADVLLVLAGVLLMVGVLHHFTERRRSDWRKPISFLMQILSPSSKRI